MFASKHKVIGILGGMGPHATVDLYQRILSLTNVKQENQHISTLIFSNPKIPDRTRCFTSCNNKKIISYLQETAKVLEDGGADVIIIPCNSAHIYLRHIQQAINIPVINMIEIAADYIFNTFPDNDSVVLLGTTAIFESGIYQNYTHLKGISIVEPNDIEKQVIMDAIYSIKLNKNLSGVRQTLLKLINSWDKPIIMGCTEIPIVLSDYSKQRNLINPTELLAKAAIDFVNNSVDSVKRSCKSKVLL